MDRASVGKLSHVVAIGAMGLLLAACAAPAPRPIEQSDPLEAVNRGVHQFNLLLDKAVLRPAAVVAGPVLRSPVGTGITNFSDNLGLPLVVANDVLQARLGDATHNSWRFAVNSTIGIAGVLDPATPMGLEERKTDFGATLHTWGVGEGPFVVLPGFGPSTARDAVGTAVEFAADPLDSVLTTGEQDKKTGALVLSKLSDRARLMDTVDSILYESADSYSQMRLMYLQSRRFELGQEASDDAFIDPYENAGSN